MTIFSEARPKLPPEFIPERCLTAWTKGAASFAGPTARLNAKRFFRVSGHGDRAVKDRIKNRQ
jgi:hypothetical protein